MNLIKKYYQENSDKRFIPHWSIRKENEKIIEGYDIWDNLEEECVYGFAKFDDEKQCNEGIKNILYELKISDSRVN